MYIRSLCLRRTSRFEEASSIYKKVRKAFMYDDRQRMIRSAFGMLLLPMVEDRYQILNALDVMLKYINVYGQQNDPIMRPLSGTFWQPENQ